MIPTSRNELMRRKSLSPRRDPSKLRRSRRFSPLHEILEARITPTGNILVISAAVVNSSGTPLSTINIGETVDVQVKFQTTNLPSTASYSIDFEVNGLILNSGPITSGAGSTGTQTYTDNSSAFSADFIASPGTNQALITVDPAHTVVESSYTDNSASTTFSAVGPQVGGLSYTTAQMRQAYGINMIPNFGTATADGTGQTIAIVDAYNDPTSVSDLDGFDKLMSLTTTSDESLYQAYGPASSFFNVFNQAGQNITADIANSGSDGVPQQDDGWDGEITLDIEWAHSIAPGAKIDLVEANSASDDLDLSDQTAAHLPGVSEVSNSWGSDEYSSELGDDANFVTPAGHNGVTFLASTGDDGAPGGYPAYSPNVVAVGGTQLNLSSNGYGSESAWNLPAPRTLNNGSSSYSQTGNWSSASGGFSGTYSTASGGSQDTATWTTSITGDDQGNGGETAVSATWVANPANATNATYTIYDGTPADGTVIGSVTVDQTKAPVGTPEGNTQFQELGQFYSSTGTLSVVLNASSANGKVVADAIGIASASADGGGISIVEPEPEYQLAVQSTGFRTIPDVSFDASVNSPVDFFESGYLEYGIAGTSLACPCWAGLISIVNQGRVSIGGQTLNSTGNQFQTQDGLYSLPSTDFHDITSGYNGFEATAGYDEATGIGSPITNLLVPDLVTYQNIDELYVAAQPIGSVVAGASFGFSVGVETPGGQPVTSYNGPVTIALAKDPGSGVLNGTLTVNAVNGIATFTGLSLDTAGTGYTIKATASGLASVTSSPLNVLAASPSKLVIASEPSSTVKAGSPFSLTVDVVDSFGNTVTSDNGTVTIGLGSNPGGSVLGGVLTVSTVNGVATFSGLTLTKAAAGYTLTVSRSGLTGKTTTPITVTAGAAAQLVVVEAPQSGVVAGTAFSLEVAIEDLYGNLEASDSSTPVSASLLIGAGPLQGTTTVMDSGGIADFTNLVDDKAVTIALQFTNPSLNNANSANIVIRPGVASQLVIQDQPSSSATAGVAFPLQPLIYEEDSFGNLVFTDTTTVISASMATGTGQLLGSTTAVINDGAAKFSNLADNKGETITLKFAGGGLNTPISNAIVVNKLVPTISLTSATGTGTYKQSTTFTAVVGPPAGGTTPTGTVTFLDGSTVLGSATIKSGVATFSTSSLLLGTQSVTAVYSGDSNNASVTSLATQVYVTDLVNDDFDGDGKSDLAVFGFNPTYGKYGFTIKTSSSGFQSTTFFDNNGYGYGNSQSIPIVGDFFGDGRDSYALWTPNSLGGMTFTAISPVSGKGININFGGVNDLPVVADIDGDGKDDFGVYGYQAGLGYRFDFLLSSDNFNGNQQYVFNNNGYGYGNAQSIPVVADFDGSGRAGFGLYNPSSTGSTFVYANPFSKVSFTRTISPTLGTVNDIPMAVSYSGGAAADLALYGPDPSHPGEYRYLVLTSNSGFNPSNALTFNNAGLGYGTSLSIPVMANYEGTGKDDFGVYTPDLVGGMQFIFQTDQTGAGVTEDFGTVSEVPLTAPSYLIAKKVRSL